jgi:O-methyltransferase
MNCFDCRRNFHVYDSFEGISAPTEGDEGLPDCIKKGDIPSTEAVLIEKFKQFGLQPPVVHKGWVEDILPQQLPKHIAFAHIDVDLYEPIKDSLRAVYPRICHRGIVLVDDYGHPDWPGAKRAADEFAQTITEPLNSLDFHERIAAQYQAFFRKEFMRQTLR